MQKQRRAKSCNKKKVVISYPSVQKVHESEIDSLEMFVGCSDRLQSLPIGWNLYTAVAMRIPKFAVHRHEIDPAPITLRIGFRVPIAAQVMAKTTPVMRMAFIMMTCDHLVPLSRQSLSSRQSLAESAISAANSSSVQGPKKQPTS